VSCNSPSTGTCGPPSSSLWFVQKYIIYGTRIIEARIETEALLASHMPGSTGSREVFLSSPRLPTTEIIRMITARVITARAL